jgi:hypothetical protein
MMIVFDQLSVLSVNAAEVEIRRGILLTCCVTARVGIGEAEHFLATFYQIW